MGVKPGAVCRRESGRRGTTGPLENSPDNFR